MDDRYQLAQLTGQADHQVAAFIDAEATPSRLLGQLLVAKGFFSDERLERLLIEELATGTEINELVVRHGLVSGNELTNALIELLGYEVMSTDDEPRPIPDFERLDAELAQVEVFGCGQLLRWISEDGLPPQAPTLPRTALKAEPPSGSDTQLTELEALQHGMTRIETALTDVTDVLSTIRTQVDTSRDQNRVGFA